MRRLLLALAALLSVALLAVAAATADTWTDPAGDAEGGPDVTAVTVTSDAAGTISFDVTVALPTGAAMWVVMDTNLNGTSNDPTDRSILVTGLAPGVATATAYLLDDISGELVATPAPTLRVEATETDVMLSMSKTDVNVADGFGFWIGTAQTPDQEGFSDDVPDGSGSLVYMLTKPVPVVVKPVIHKPTTVPARAVAGKRFTVTFAVTRSDNGKPLTGGKMTCDPKVAGKVLGHRESFRNGKARLSLVIPGAAKGKTLRVNLTIRTNVALASKVVTFRVR